MNSFSIRRQFRASPFLWGAGRRLAVASTVVLGLWLLVAWALHWGKWVQ